MDITPKDIQLWKWSRNETLQAAQRIEEAAQVCCDHQNGAMFIVGIGPTKPIAIFFSMAQSLIEIVKSQYIEKTRSSDPLNFSDCWVLGGCNELC